MSEANKPSQPKFTLEFKQDAARLVIKKGHAHQQAAASLGASLSALRRWVRAERGGGGSDGGQKAALDLAGQQELAREARKTSGCGWSAKS